ncbi:voltage-dependent anion channel-domain-containing protein [Xylaria telfairii]|nr:voltage-dependent anion channel-domain-containing protein [Xylaria telfairii]
MHHNYCTRSLGTSHPAYPLLLIAFNFLSARLQPKDTMFRPDLGPQQGYELVNLSGASTSTQNNPPDSLSLPNPGDSQSNNSNHSSTPDTAVPDTAVPGSAVPGSAVPGSVHNALQSLVDMGVPEPGVSLPTRCRRAFWAFVEKFNFGWFTWSVGLGASSILINDYSIPFPQYQRPLAIVSLVFAVINSIMFSTAVILVVTRYVRWPRPRAFMMTDPRQVALVAMMPIALGTIIIMASRFVGNESGLVVVYVFWLIEVLLSLVVEIGIALVIVSPNYIFQRINHPGARTAS